MTFFKMIEAQMIKAINKVDGLGGMTVNERLYVTGLLNEFDKAKESDKAKARRILELLNVDNSSIDKILQ
jgi:hypothetical protein